MILSWQNNSRSITPLAPLKIKFPKANQMQKNPLYIIEKSLNSLNRVEAAPITNYVVGASIQGNYNNPLRILLTP
jgi:hypothetical protein